MRKKLIYSTDTYTKRRFLKLICFDRGDGGVIYSEVVLLNAK